MTRNADATSALGTRSLGEEWETSSRPSKTNLTSADSSAVPPEKRSSPGYWWKQKNAIVDRFIEEMPNRAVRPVSVRDGTKLREDCTSEMYGHKGFRSNSWSAVLNAFLNWYNNYRHAHLKFKDPDGNTVRAQMPNSHQPRYGNRYYAKIKGLERQMVQNYDDLHVALLTFSGSSKNARGGWRCPCDHLRDVVSSWLPDRGRGVYHALRDALDGKDWEYCTVVEKHQSGYGHVHVAVFVDGEVTESDFHDAIDAHLRVCDIAHRDAHDYHHPDPRKTPISVSPVNPDIEPDHYGSEDVIGNLGSYIGEYIGAHGEALFDRDLSELIFRASVWATGTQLVRFSTGANEMIRDDLGRETVERLENKPVTVPNPSFDPEQHATPDSDVKPFEHVNPGWSIEGVCRVSRDGAERRSE